MSGLIRIVFLVDLQNGFVKPGLTLAQGGSRYVPGSQGKAERAADFILNLSDSIIILTQDFHPPNHISYAGSSERVHCVQGTESALFADAIMSELPLSLAEQLRGSDIPPILSAKDDRGNIYYVMRKGMKPHIDSYGISRENDGSLNVEVLNCFEEIARDLQQKKVVGVNHNIGGGLLNYCVEFVHDNIYQDFIPILQRCGIQSRVSLLTDISFGVPKKVAGGAWPDLGGTFSSMAVQGTAICTTDDVVREIVNESLLKGWPLIKVVLQV